jgi:hypothetical protein
VKRAASAFVALAAATVAIAQVNPAEPPASNTQRQQSPKSTTPPSEQNPGMSSESGKASQQALMKDCMTQVQAANPGVLEQDIKKFCEKEIGEIGKSSPKD